MIKILDQLTINKIAAGEVIERPSSVVKELVENSIDAGATAVTVEIKEGGTTFIRITDNGQGIEKDEVPTAFIRHATSKILTIEDLLSVSSLGFRGEALASIAAVAQVECITKTAHALTGIRYEIHGGKEIASEEVGAPTGTTLIVRNLFYNVPARKKFLKTVTTEASYITELITRLALSHPDVSFKYIVNGSNKIATSGNGVLKDVIYHIYGKDVSANLLPVKRDNGEFGVEGYIGKSFVYKGNRNSEHYFINGRAIRNPIITKAIEEAYKSFIMIHKFPFTALHFTLDSSKLDVNVHPAKMEFKYADGEKLFDFVKESVRQALLQEEMIPDVSLRTTKEEKAVTIEQQRKITSHVPEPFEKEARAKRYQEAFSGQQTLTGNDIPSKNTENTKKPDKTDRVMVNDRPEDKEQINAPAPVQATIQERSPAQSSDALRVEQSSVNEEKAIQVITDGEKTLPISVGEEKSIQISVGEGMSGKASANDGIPVKASADDAVSVKVSADVPKAAQTSFVEESSLPASSDVGKPEQLTLPVEQFISPEARRSHRLIGQLFRTYWLIEYDNKLFIMDQHAAHEKVMFAADEADVREKSVVTAITPAKSIASGQYRTQCCHAESGSFHTDRV